MKKTVPVFLFLFLPLFLFSTNNNFASSAGTMDLTPQTGCAGDIFVPVHNGDATLDPGDILRFILHDNSGTTLGITYSGQVDLTGAFSFQSGMTFDSTYYISAIAGMDDGNGNVDLTDPELSVAQGTPVIFYSETSLTIDAVICEGEVYTDFGQTYNTTGNFVCIVLTNVNGCDSTIYLNLEVLNPLSGILPPAEIDCGPNATVTLEAVVTDPSPNVDYVWSGPCIVSGTGTPNITVDCGGEYTLLVSKTEQGVTCISDPFSVTVSENTTPPIADAGPDQEITCVNASVTLGDSGSSMGSEFVYSWTGPSGFTSNEPNPTVSQSGTYCLFVVNTITFCQSIIDCVTVTGNIIPPIADAGVDQVLTCANSEVVIGGLNTSSGAIFVYSWLDSNGNAIPGAVTMQIVVTAAGEYCLEVTNTNNGCYSVECVTVSSDITAPAVNTSSNGNINCVSQTVLLFANGVCNGLCDYLWSTGDPTQTITVNAAGFYTVTVTDISNGCTTEESIVVFEDTALPTISISSPSTINCADPCVTVDATVSGGLAPYSFEWYYLGNVISNTQVLTVCNPGQYEVIVTGSNGCSSVSTVIIDINANIPIADAGPNQTLDCITSEAVLDGSNSSLGPNIIYEWADANGSVIGTNISITVNTPGEYTLIVTDADNGCTGSSSVLVEGDGALGVDLGDDFIFDCTVSEIMIQGDNVPTGAGFTYLWTTVDGNILVGVDTPTPTINSPGTYVLEINDVPNGCIGMDEIIILDINDMVLVNSNMNLNCNTNNPNILDATLLNSSQNLDFLWATLDGQIISGANTLNPVVGSVGTYTLTYTDVASGCSNSSDLIMGDFIFPTSVIDAPDGLVLSCNMNFLILDGSNSAGTGALAFQWSWNGVLMSGGVSITVNAPGVYELLVIDLNNDCVDAATVVVTDDFEQPTFTLPNTVSLDCNNNFTQMLEVVLDPILPNVSYSWTGPNGWSEVGSMVTFSGVEEGLYEVLVTNLDNGCATSFPFQVTDDGFDIDISITPADCDQENGTATATTVLPNSLVEWSNGEQGNSISNLSQGWYSVTITDTDNNCNKHKNFFVDEDISCKVVIAGFVLNDPDSTCTYDFSLGGVECVLVKLEPLGIYTLSDSSGYFEFVVDDGSYTVEFEGSPEVDLICPNPGSYDVVLDTNGSISDENHFFVQRQDFDLCITKFTGNARPGLPQFNCIQICNYSDDVQDAVASFVHDSIFSDQSPWPSITPASGNIYAPNYTYEETTNTFTWNLTDLAPGECRKIMWYMTGPTSAMVGDILSSEAKVNPIAGDENPDNNCLAWNQTVTGSYDPNDKRNFVGENEWGGAIYEDDIKMEYAIRFQNVGNDTAFTVVVRDTLDNAHLDVTTMRGFTSSHDMQVEFEEQNILIFRFENINLVDSFTNEPASNGWLSFDINRLPGQDFGTEIKNQASIYFDFNEPIVTNEVINTLTEIVSVFSPTKNEIQVEVMPNVTNDLVQVNFVLEKSSLLTLSLFNTDGIRVQEFDLGKKVAGEHQFELSLKSLPTGVCFVLLKTEEGSSVKRVVKF